MEIDEDIVARLRASKAEAHDEDEEVGKEHGADWARTTAGYRELKRCQALYDQMRHNNTAIDLDTFCKEVLKTEDSSDVEGFVEKHIDEDSSPEDVSDEFVAGFIEGAAEVWNEVAHKV